ncbi:hypothetical protein [Nocardia brasiliensis]
MTLGMVASCSSAPKTGSPNALDLTTTRPASSTMTEPIAGVGFRDDCAELRLDVIGHPCQPRVPTAVPPAGAVFDVYRNGGGRQVSSMLCSVLPDAEMAELLGGPFHVWTDSQFCHFSRLPEQTGFTNDIAVGLDPDSVTEFRATDGPDWHAYPVGDIPGGYVDAGDGRWFRIGSDTNPDSPGTVLILCTYQEYGTFKTEPTPESVVSAWEQYVQHLMRYLTRPA